ncbi:MAG: GNAT family N-acetyltransferase, partial [Spirochaetota bacterium]|nr:GNAT family N-acetyltransferase [Spirochaetota bacterium]
NTLERHSFEFADVKITNTINLEDFHFSDEPAELATHVDINELKEMSATLFSDSRYYHEKFNKEKVNEFFQIWVEKAVLGQYDDYCIKVQNGGTIAGYITTKLLGEAKARIGLIAVKPQAQNLGIGTKLIKSLFKFLYEKEIRVVSVVTQGKNISAQNFYLKRGFLINKLEHWYYKFLFPIMKQ